MVIVFEYSVEVTIGRVVSDRAIHAASGSRLTYRVARSQQKIVQTDFLEDHECSLEKVRWDGKVDQCGIPRTANGRAAAVIERMITGRLSFRSKLPPFAMRDQKASPSM